MIARRRVVVVELVGVGRHPLGGQLVDLQRRAGEAGVPDQRAEGHGRRRVVVAERILGRDRRGPRGGHAQRRGDLGLVVARGSPALGYGHVGALADGQADGDEEPLLLVVGAVEDRHAGEPPGGQRGPDRLGEDLAVDDAGDLDEVGAHQVGDGQAAQAGRGLVRAARLGGEGLAGGLGGGEGLLVEREGPALR